MDAPLHEFRVAMCAEHLEEAAALFDIAAALRSDAQANWTDAGPFEQRIERHIDGLVLGGSAADAVCDAALAAADDPGACHAAAAAAAIRGDTARLRKLVPLLQDAAAEPPQVVIARAVAQAWVSYLPAALEPELLRALDEGANSATLWHAVADRRCDTEGRLARALVSDRATPQVNAALVAARWYAAARCRDRVDPDVARADYGSDDATVRAQALACGLRRRDVQALKRIDEAAAGCASDLRRAAIPPLLLACAAGASSARAIMKTLTRAPEAAVVHALGVCGSLAAVRPLLECVSEPALAAAAALALHVLTGLAPMEDARIDDSVDEDELFERERERFIRDGSAPKAADGLPYAQHVRRLTQDPDAWREVLHDAAQTFGAGVRYRFGRPYSASSLLEGLLRAPLPHELRRAFIDEAQFRHGLDLRLDPGSLVRFQRASLESPRLTATARADPSPPGRWCREGRALN